MKKTLYLISKPQDEDMNTLLSFPVSANHSISAIVIQQETGFIPTVPFPLFFLNTDMTSNDMTEPYSKIQYSDMLRMIFEADTVISI